MKKTTLSMIFVFVLVSFCNAQKIESHKVFGGYRFTQNNHQMTMKELVQTVKPNAEAYKIMKKARTNHTLSSILGFEGGALIGWPIGAAIGGGDPDWALAGIGAGVIAVTIPISISAGKKTHQAVELYNESLGLSFYKDFNSRFQFALTGTGMGIALKL